MITIPESPNTYQGNQVIINSDRLVFNAKKEAILLYSDKAIGFSTNGNFHFDTLNKSCSNHQLQNRKQGDHYTLTGYIYIYYLPNSC